ncbi:hypothetical protein [Allonocardiopsis opalescens]|uniref:Uncharacterized protein n=1 Tax=Allonocardiopsis opalescens TaxID=1144618 RepID=A0A2T0PSW4_9ACTN|nr:hypothetical protein [Allonocardiopsis opalescens]PRX91989.1 hypothetical protein CLV72_11262 [Allonocardiopsis opalescens]
MHLLVVKDMARMPRLRAALLGEDTQRPFDEANYQLALISNRLQMLEQVLHVGLRLKGKPRPFKAYPVPGVSVRGGKKQRAVKPKVNPKHMAYLDRFSPGKAPPIGAPPPPSSERRRPSRVKTA